LSKETPDQGVKRFEHRAGTEEVPTIGGMSRLGDEAQIPVRQHHLLVNVRFGPGEMSSRPGLEETDDLGEAACITGLIETVENTGTGGGLVTGLLTGYWYGYGPDPSNDHYLYLNPDDDDARISGDPTQARPLIKTPAVFGDGAHVTESFWPAGGMISHYWGILGCGPSEPVVGPLNPFTFQGNTCVLGGTPDLGIFAVVAADDNSSGALNRINNFGNYAPVSSVIREEIIGGAVTQVLYFSATDGNVYRFDGTTLSLWWSATVALAEVFYWRLFVSGQEMLLLGDHTVAVDLSGSALPPGTATFGQGVIYYQAAPGGVISFCSITATNYSMNRDPVTGETANRSIGWTGATRYRDKWFVFLQCQPASQHTPPPYLIPEAYSQILEATVGAAALSFTVVWDDVLFLPGPGGEPSQVYVSQPVTFKDDVYFFTGWFSRCVGNGSDIRIPEDFFPDDHSLWLGRFDGVTWDPFYVNLLQVFPWDGAVTGAFFELAQPNWLYPNGDILIASVSAAPLAAPPVPPVESLYFWRDVDALGPFPFGNVEDVRFVTSPGLPPTAGSLLLPLGSKSVYYAIPDEVD